jgi:hypothetical protein
MFSKGLVKAKNLTTPRVKKMDLGIRFAMARDIHLKKLREIASQILEIKGQSLKFWVVSKHCDIPSLF